MDANRLAFASADNALRKDLSFVFELWNRKGYYQQHKAKAVYANQQIVDSINVLNPLYFPKGVTRAKFLEFTYTYIYDFRDFQAYPTSGYYVEAVLRQRGLGLVSNFAQTTASLSYSKYIPLSKKVYFSSLAKIKYSTPEQIGHAYASGLGYKQDFVRGYDLYVVNGPRALLNRNTLRLKAFQQVLKPKFIPFKAFSTIPLSLYPKVFFDMGYVDNREIITQEELFANKLLKGWGVGIDVVSFYNAVMRFEYSMNSDGDRGVYLYWKAGF